MGSVLVDVPVKVMIRFRDKDFGKKDDFLGALFFEGIKEDFMKKNQWMQLVNKEGILDKDRGEALITISITFGDSAVKVCVCKGNDF